MLQLPPTLRFAYTSEIPDEKGRERLAEAKNARLEEGFVLKANEDNALPFDFFAVVNVNNERLWDVFLSLSEHLPEDVGCIYGKYDDDLVYSDYIPREDAIIIMGKYKIEITLDCNMQAGLVHSTDDLLLEVFISETKYISFWGMDEAGFRQSMKEFDLSEVPGLRFIDEFPTVVTPLSKVLPNARPTKDVISALYNGFKKMQ